jgi:hypothetical protein
MDWLIYRRSMWQGVMFHDADGRLQNAMIAAHRSGTSAMLPAPLITDY